MVVTFEKEYLRDLYLYGRCADKKHRYQPEIVRGYQRRIQQLQAVPRSETLYTIHSLHFEALLGDREGLFSIRVNNKYRIEFTLTADADSPLLTICNIVELSNHYD
ncbi:MAG: addiction module killer protein [Bacteroides sp.]|nr:addiction module killer protein [Bacteroides sp.]MDE6042078.1 type II toxin-antitoxin system RelE/ParE family toxin [Muribaculaceae bacterium]